MGNNLLKRLFHMVRKAVVVLVVLGILGAGAYFLLGNKDTNAQGKDADAGRKIVTTSAPAPEGSSEYWTKRCEEKVQYCEIFQRLTLKENNQRLVELAVGYPKDVKGAQAAIILPLGVVLTDGIALKVDDQAPAMAKFRACGKDGCYIVMSLPDAFISSMKSGKKLIVSFLDGTGKQINVQMSLDGFAEKLNEVQR